MKKGWLITLRLLSIASASLLIGCEYGSGTNPEVSPTDSGESFREVVFSFDSVSSIEQNTLRLGRAGNAATASSTISNVITMDTATYFYESKAIIEQIKDTAFANYIPRALDYSCDLVDLALLSKYKTIIVAGDTIISHNKVKERCVALEPNIVGIELGRSISGQWPSNEVQIKVGDYKLIGKSWTKYGGYVYASSGGSTTFHKYREKYLWLGKHWYELDANKIGVRVYYFHCPKIKLLSQQGYWSNDYAMNSFNTEVSENACFNFAQVSSHDNERNSSSVSERAFAISIGITTKLNDFTPRWDRTVLDFISEISGVRLNKVNSFLADVDPYTWTAQNGIKDPSLKSIATNSLGMGRTLSRKFLDPLAQIRFPITIQNVSANVPDGVYSLHSVDHGALKFRGVTSSGLLGKHVITDVATWDFVNW